MTDTTPRPDEPHDEGTRAPDTPVDDGTSAAPPDVPPAAEAPEPPPAPDAPDAPPTVEAAPAPEAPPAPGAPGEPSVPPPPPPGPQTYGQQQAPAALPAGQATMSPQDERTWSMATHGITLGALVLSGGTLGFVAALVMYLVYRDRGPYIRANTANALNIQITTIIGVLISFVLMFVLIGFVTIFLVGIYALVLHIIGIVKANNGEWWDPPLTPKFVR